MSAIDSVEDLWRHALRNVDNPTDGVAKGQLRMFWGIINCDDRKISSRITQKSETRFESEHESFEKEKG